MTTTVKRVTLGLAAAALSIGVSAGVYAGSQDQNTNQTPRPFMGGQGRGGGRFGGPDGGRGLLPMIPRELQLTDAQRDQIRAIAQSHRDEWKAIADRGRPAHEALRAAIASDTINEGLIREKSADVAAIEADLNVARAHARAEITKILTAEQKTKLKELESQGPGRGRGRGPRG
jgi:periplasmic protein CpxP/Spy